jgi:heptosyltransferase-2
MRRFLIFAPNWLGDAVMALPAIADVRRAVPPDTRIVVAGRRSVAGLFGMVRGVDEVVTMTSADDLHDQFDVAILLPNSFRSALAASRARIPERWGYRSQWRGSLLTRAVDPPPRGIHQVDAYRRLVEALGFSNGGSDPSLDVPSDFRDAAARALASAGWDQRKPLVSLAPGAAYGIAKRWPPEYFADLARALADDGMQPVLVGSGADEPTIRAVEKALGEKMAVNLAGKTDVPLLAGVLALSRALVSNDSGAMHLGAAVGTRVTAVFGPTSERLTAPRGLNSHVVLTHAVWCRPCMLRECPLDHGCLRGIGVDRVLEATRRML